MSDLEQRLAGLSPTKRALLQARLQRTEQVGPQGQTVPKRANHDPSPISFVQERIWLHEQLVPGSVVYNRPTNLRLQGPVNPESLCQALNAVVARHESLRTTVTINGDVPELRLHSSVQVEMPFTDLSHENTPEQEAKHLAREEVSRPFDLEKGPLNRSHLLRLGDLEHLLLLTFHHFTFDAWSLTVLLEELTQNYKAYNNGSTPELEAPVIQYADFAAWDRCEQRVAGFDTGRAYWRGELADLPVLQLPTDFLRKAVPSEEAGNVDIDLPKELITGLRELGGREGTTMFCVLLAAFGSLLYRYSWQKDIIIGCPVAGRSHVEMEGLIGVFINSLPFRLSLDGTDTFRQILQHVHASIICGLEHQEVPLQLVVQDVLTDRAPGGSPLFQTMFIHERFPLPDHADADLVFTPEDTPHAATMVDVLLELMESPSSISGRIVYRRELWEHDSIKQMAGHFLTLLEGIVANPDQRIFDLPLLSDHARKAMAAQRNTVAPDNEFIAFHVHPDDTIPQRFKSQVGQFPHHIAVQTAGDEWSYAQLDNFSDQIARSIHSITGFREGHAALLFDHGAPMIAAILGALKAGQAFVPLDPLSPIERLQSILLDSQADILVTEDSHFALANQITHDSLAVINIDELHQVDSSDSLPDISADRTAYLLYTSGTTGQPKAAIQNHRNVLRHSANYTNSIHISDRDKLTLFSSYTADAAIMDIFGAILNGATVCPVDLRTWTTKQVWGWVHKVGITVYHSTPTVYRHLVNEIPSDLKPNSVRIVVLGGESVYAQDVELYRNTFREDCLLVNGMGLTESTTALQFFMNKQTPLLRHSVPVGYAVADTEILIVNELGMPLDVMGEIAIRSRQIALGYWREPEQTSLKFSSDETDGESRIYRTGDMGRMLTDGSLVFIGRNDSQIKLRGYRIELGEIESVLNNHPDVAGSLVMLREDHPEEKRLVAYCVWAADTPLIPSDLRNHIRSRLPDYMVPAAFVELDAVPLTTTGKVNRQALLPAPEKFTQSTSSSAEPRDFLEKRLQQIWQQTFNSDSIGLQDNFFDLGGHSLLAVRLVAEVEKLLGRSLPIASLFQTPTIESLACLLREDKDATSWTSLVPLQPQGSNPPFFFVHGWSGDVYGFVGLARFLAPDQPVYGLQAIDRYGGTERHTCVEEMAAHYVQEIRSFQPEGPYYLGGYSLGGWIAYEVAQQLTRQGQRVQMLAFFDTRPTLRMPRLLALRYQLPNFTGKMMRRIIFHAHRSISMPRHEFKDYLKSRWNALLFLLWKRYRQPLPQPHDPKTAVPPPTTNRLDNYYRVLVSRYRPTNFTGAVDLFASEQMNPAGERMLQHLALSGVKTHHVMGDHFTMIDEDNVQELVEVFRKALLSSQK